MPLSIIGCPKLAIAGSPGRASHAEISAEEFAFIGVVVEKIWLCEVLVKKHCCLPETFNFEGNESKRLVRVSRVKP